MENDGAVAIPLGKSGLVTWVDAADIRLIEGYKWYALRRPHTTYVYTKFWNRQAQKSNIIYLHRLLLGLCQGDKRQTDHRNHNGLDNRRSNLRIATQSQNCANAKKARGKSRYKGVHPCGGISHSTDRIPSRTTQNLTVGSIWKARRTTLKQLIAANRSLEEIGTIFNVTRERARQAINALGLQRFKACNRKSVNISWMTAIRSLNRQINHRVYGFATEEEAAMCYNVLARRYHGEFAYQNQVDMG